ncbi:MAG: metallopeptidase [Planctomycetaceae bacterium]|nr:metallopeptidase [Planctomycetaceae bacterium]
MFQKSLFVILVFTWASSVQAEIKIANHQDETTVRYPVILLRGTADAQAKALTVRVAGAEKECVVVRHDNRFKSLVKLKHGNNVIELQADQEKPVQLKIAYDSQTNPHYVRVIWMTDSEGDTTFAAPSDDVPQDYAARLRTAAQLMQTFTAESMNGLGFGRRTFRLERDDDGQIVVHTLKAPKKAEHYYQLQDGRWFGETYRWLNQEHGDPLAKNMVLAAFTRKDPETKRMKAHTALGGGNLGLFGSASVFSWPRDLDSAISAFQDAKRVDPTQVHDDSAGRNTYWGLASTTIGATLHEMGHTFGLPHCKDRFGIMTRGFDHFNRAFTFSDPPSGRNRVERVFTKKQEAYFAPISASYLRWSRWLQLDEQEYSNTARPRIEIDAQKKQVKVSSDSGVAWVGFWVGSDVHSHRDLKGELPKSVEYSFEEIKKLLGGKTLSHVTTISSNGISARKSVERKQ